MSYRRSISVIIPCYNAEKFLPKAIESVLAQSSEVTEIIVVDDCSSDESALVASQYPVQLIKLGVNSGHAAARNRGIDASCGEWVFWLDADDFWDANHVSTLLDVIDSNPQSDVVYSGVRFFGNVTGSWLEEPLDCPQCLFFQCFARTIVPAMSCGTRRSVLKKIGGFDSAIRTAPDFDLWLRLSRICKFASSKNHTANYRFHDSQISRAPVRQQVSIHQSRIRMVQQLCLEGEKNLAKKAASVERWYWRNDIDKASRGPFPSVVEDLLQLQENLGSMCGRCSLSHTRVLLSGLMSRFKLRFMAQDSE